MSPLFLKSKLVNSESILGAIKQANIFTLRYLVNIQHLSHVLVNDLIFRDDYKQLLLSSTIFVGNVPTRIPDNLFWVASDRLRSLSIDIKI